MSKYPIVALSTATVIDLSWLAGHWTGGRGNTHLEEQWSTPAGGAMMGMFRWLEGDRPRFYEFMTIAQEEEGVILRIKHFDPGLSGWEEKEESVAFLLVQLGEGEAIFVKQGSAEPLWAVYRRTGGDGFTVYFENAGEPPDPDDAFNFTRSTV